MSMESLYRTFSSSRLPMKDALRNIRFAFRRGRDLLDAPAEWSPEPLGRAFKGVLSTVDRVALNAEAAIIRAEHRIFDEELAGDPRKPAVDRLRGAPDDGALFAQFSFEVLSRALLCLGAKYGLVSESRAAEAFAAAALSDEAVGDGADEAARLYVAMRDRGVIRDVVGSDGAATFMTSEEYGGVALFAALLWFFAEPSGAPEDDESLLEDCCVFAQALRADLADASASHDRLSRLFALYIDKV